MATKLEKGHYRFFLPDGSAFDVYRNPGVRWTEQVGYSACRDWCLRIGSRVWNGYGSKKEAISVGIRYSAGDYDPA